MCIPLFAGVGVAMGASASSAAAVGTMAVVSTVATLASAAIGTISAISSAKSQSDAAKYNAKVQEMQARDALTRGNIQAQEIRDRTRRLQGTQSAQYGAAGLDINFGTPSDVLSETRQYGELDALKAINNAQRGAWGNEAERELELYKGRTAKRAGYMQAGGSLLSGATNLYGIWRPQ